MVGTILLIALTVILAGTIGFFVMQQGIPETMPEATYSIKKTGGGAYEFQHNGGDTLHVGQFSLTNENR